MITVLFWREVQGRVRVGLSELQVLEGGVLLLELVLISINALNLDGTVLNFKVVLAHLLDFFKDLSRLYRGVNVST